MDKQTNFHVISNVKIGDIYLDPFHETPLGPAVMVITEVDNMGSRFGIVDRIVRYEKYVPNDNTYVELTLIDPSCSLWAGSIKGVKYPGKYTDFKFKK